MTQAALPAMRRAGAGVVVGVSTLSGRIPWRSLFGMYSASKMALAAILEALELELGPEGVRAVLIEAGVVRTELALADGRERDGGRAGVGVCAGPRWCPRDAPRHPRGVRAQAHEVARGDRARPTERAPPPPPPPPPPKKKKKKKKQKKKKKKQNRFEL